LTRLWQIILKMAFCLEKAISIVLLLSSVFCLIDSKAINHKKKNVVKDQSENDIQSQLFVWRVVSVSEYEMGSPVKSDMHGIDGKLPICAQNQSKHHFVSEVCMTLKPADTQDTTPIGFQHCDCSQSSSACSRSFDPDDPYTYATIENMQLKTCVHKSHIPVCTTANKRRRGGVVAKLWYGEDLPQRVLLNCRCPRGYVWGRLQCTSSGRICFVMGCEKI